MPKSGLALDETAALGAATAWETAGVCTTIVFFVPFESQPAAFPTTRTEMPPITAATIATIAMGAGRSRTDRTVAVGVPGARAEDPFELRTACYAKLRPP